MITRPLGQITEFGNLATLARKQRFSPQKNLGSCNIPAIFTLKVHSRAPHPTLTSASHPENATWFPLHNNNPSCPGHFFLSCSYPPRSSPSAQCLLHVCCGVGNLPRTLQVIDIIRTMVKDKAGIQHLYKTVASS